MNWLGLALLSAVFAALTSILAKIGIKGVDSNLATAIRTSVVLLFAWGIVIFTQKLGEINKLPAKTWVFLGLSGIATGLSWLCYFRALQLGEASKVAPIDKLSLVLTIFLAALILQEKVTVPIVLGGVLMTLGALMIAFWK